MKSIIFFQFETETCLTSPTDINITSLDVTFTISVTLAKTKCAMAPVHLFSFEKI